MVTFTGTIDIAQLIYVWGPLAAWVLYNLLVERNDHRRMIAILEKIAEKEQIKIEKNITDSSTV